MDFYFKRPSCGRDRRCTPRGLYVVAADVHPDGRVAIVAAVHPASLGKHIERVFVC
jgi:hypothetical protein